MSSRLTDEQLAIAQAKHMAQGMEMLMGAMLKPAPRADMDLHWTEFQLNDCDWCLHLGYSRSGDPFDDGTVKIVRIVLNTGQRDVNLTGADLDSNTWSCCEEQCFTDWQVEVTRDARA